MVTCLGGFDWIRFCYLLSHFLHVGIDFYCYYNQCSRVDVSRGDVHQHLMRWYEDDTAEAPCVTVSFFFLCNGLAFAKEGSWCRWDFFIVGKSIRCHLGPGTDVFFSCGMDAIALSLENRHYPRLHTRELNLPTLNPDVNGWIYNGGEI